MQQSNDPAGAGQMPQSDPGLNAASLPPAGAPAANRTVYSFETRTCEDTFAHAQDIGEALAVNGFRHKELQPGQELSGRFEIYHNQRGEPYLIEAQSRMSFFPSSQVSPLTWLDRFSADYVIRVKDAPDQVNDEGFTRAGSQYRVDILAYRSLAKNPDVAQLQQAKHGDQFLFEGEIISVDPLVLAAKNSQTVTFSKHSAQMIFQSAALENQYYKKVQPGDEVEFVATWIDVYGSNGAKELYIDVNTSQLALKAPGAKRRQEWSDLRQELSASLKNLEQLITAGDYREARREFAEFYGKSPTTAERLTAYVHLCSIPAAERPLGFLAKKYFVVDPIPGEFADFEKTFGVKPAALTAAEFVKLLNEIAGGTHFSHPYEIDSGIHVARNAGMRPEELAPVLKRTIECGIAELQQGPGKDRAYQIRNGVERAFTTATYLGTPQTTQLVFDALAQLVKANAFGMPTDTDLHGLAWRFSEGIKAPHGSYVKLDAQTVLDNRSVIDAALRQAYYHHANSNPTAQNLRPLYYYAGALERGRNLR